MEEISLEETNRIRVANGLKPIAADTVIDTGSVHVPDDARVTSAQAKVQSRIEDARKRAELRRGQDLKGLAEDGEDNDDNNAFLLRLRKRKLVHLEEDPPEPSYDEADLKGLRVAHSLSDVSNSATILTLKDTEFVDGEDVLESVDLVEQKRVQVNIRNRKGLEGTKVYGEKRDLFKMREEEEHDENQGFVLGDKVPMDKEIETSEKLPAATFDLALDQIQVNGEHSDYHSKPKFKKKKARPLKTQRRLPKFDEGPVDLQIDNGDLTQLLADKRRRVQAAQVVGPEEVAREIIAGEREYGDDGVAGFLSRVRARAMEGVKEENKDDVKEENKDVKEENKDDVKEDKVKEEFTIKGENVENVTKEHAIKEEDVTEENAKAEETAVVTRTDKNPLSSMASTLQLLKQKGVLKTQEKKPNDGSDRIRAERLRHAIEMQRQRDQDRASGKYNGLTREERELVAAHEAKEREREDARLAQELFRDYKPTVELVYRDESGRAMEPKEAYKHLSHQFHGKGSGRAKTEKRLKKIAEETKKERQSIFED